MPGSLAAYTGQIYFDFSGYSDMAVGLGLMIGFTFPENFNSPYKSLSITEFWRRWHITLSTWLKEYLYIPLGGNRGGAWATHRNLMITMLLGGLWHGPSWNFVIWGGIHGAFLGLERSRCLSFLETLPNGLRAAACLFVVAIGWVFFRSPDLPSAMAFLRSLFSLSGESFLLSQPYSTIYRFGLTLLPLAFLFACFGPNSQSITANLGVKTRIALGISFLVALMVLVARGSTAFLYFQF